MPRVSQRVKQATWAVSALVAIVLVFLGMMSYGPLDAGFHFHLILAFVAALLPPAIVDTIDYRWRRAIDRALPRFLEGIAHAQLTGLPLLRAFKEAGEGISGPLRDEVRLMMAKISWGMSFEDALKLFMRRVDTPLARRVATLIIEANRSGGVVERIFTPLAQATATFQAMEDERKAALKPYIVVTYISFAVFLVVIYMLYTSFFIPIANLPVTGLGGAMSPELCWVLLFDMGMVLAIFSGLIAGVLGEGRAYSGLKHVIIMLLLTYAVFREIIEPGWLWALLGLG